MLWASFAQGLGVGAGLIIAIGAQNAHVLRMAIKKQHVWLTVFGCILCDAIAIMVGVAGLGQSLQQSSLLMSIARWGGIIFLLWYAVQALKRSLFAQHALQVEQLSGQQMHLMVAVRLVLAVSLLNPHFYLDTIILLGSIGSQQPTSMLQYAFATGAICASMAWFILLGGTAKWLAPWLNNATAWRCIDALIAVMMFTVAYLLFRGH
ncbi:L-lysine exporter family protein LysE/ArgO [Acinetobacter boissieri]|uniref:L-lysine exporter family protein LysE/ArgO n=2 Tax=Acinetobacter boissieri TaxID=1219383 RepID=A0A1G6GLU0_9GAMM|nr:L-lysine exporter family protein LysE/ArgO [Acinetobacter boissieri]